jgi:hypothetical protein
MTDKPWENLPPAPPAPSRIITPTDTITITIDNRGAAPQAQMRVSRELPRAYVIGIFSALITQLSAEMMQEIMRGFPPQKPGSNPSAERGPNGT